MEPGFVVLYIFCVVDWLQEYKPPSVADIPIVLNVTLVPNAPNPIGFLGSKASGEPPLCMASNVLFAVKAAINSALSEVGETAYFALSLWCSAAFLIF